MASRLTIGTKEHGPHDISATWLNSGIMLLHFGDQNVDYVFANGDGLTPTPVAWIARHRVCGAVIATTSGRSLYDGADSPEWETLWLR